MPRLFREKRSLDHSRFIPLHFRFILTTSLMLIILLGTLAVAIGVLQRRTIRRQLEARGLSIAQNLAATSVEHLLTYNYIALERFANQAASDPAILSVIFHDKEGRVAGYSGRPDLQNRFLEDEVSRRAVRTRAALVQPVSLEGGEDRGVEIAVPVYPPNVSSPWGTVRVRLSLEAMVRQIAQIQYIIAIAGVLALALGTLLSILSARRITRPLGNLVAATREAARGNLDLDVKVLTGDEVEVLASNFDVMIKEIIGHRKELEIQLIEIQRLQQYLAKLLATMSDGLLTVDMQGRIHTINPAAANLLGLEEIAPGSENPPLQSLEADSKLKQYLAGIRENPGEQGAREIEIDAGGTIRNLLISASILPNAGGRPEEIILNVHDISELKKLEASMRQAERLAALGTLAAGMAHEIRNPLSAIKTFVQLLPRKVAKEGFLEKFQRTVPRELDRINNLVEDLLDLARIPKYTFRKMSVQTLLQQTVDALEQELEMGQISCSMEVDSGLPTVEVDADQLAKAFTNLTRNAIQSMPDGGQLDILASAHGPPSNLAGRQIASPAEVHIVFQDSGSGISPDDLKNIFNPFFTTKDKGTGLGLAITHKVISEHGGQIEVESRAGRGSRFIIRLPVIR